MPRPTKVYDLYQVIDDLNEKIARIDTSRLDRLEVGFSVASGVLDVSVPAGTNLVTLDYELEYPAGPPVVLLRPNGDASTLVTDYEYVTSTLSPDAITRNGPFQTSQAGFFIASNLGAAGACRAVGRAMVVTRNYSGRTVMQNTSSITNSIGSSNTYMMRLESQATYDLADAITSLRLVTSAGNFNGGVARARFV